MKIHVICCNDMIKFAVVNDEKLAQEKLEELKNATFKQVGWMVSNDPKTYEDRFFWHIHTVDGQ